MSGFGPMPLPWIVIKIGDVWCRVDAVSGASLPLPDAEQAKSDQLAKHSLLVARGRAAANVVPAESGEDKP